MLAVPLFILGFFSVLTCIRGAFHLRKVETTPLKAEQEAQVITRIVFSSLLFALVLTLALFLPLFLGDWSSFFIHTLN